MKSLNNCLLRLFALWNEELLEELKIKEDDLKNKSFFYVKKYFLSF